MKDIEERMERKGFESVYKVREIGEYEVRGGIIDIYEKGEEEKMRIDFLGDKMEKISELDKE